LSKTRKVGIAVPEKPRLYGKSIHNCLAIYFQKIPDKPTGEEIELVARETFEECKTFAMKGFKAKTKRVLENFIGFEKKRLRTWKVYKPTLVEKWMEAKIFEDLPSFRVIIDFYGDGTILDWKTGKAGGMSESRLRQGKIYELVLAKLGYSVERVTFFSLDVGTNLQVPRVTAGWIYKEARRMVDMAENDRFPKKPSGLCPYCEFQIDCEFSDRCLFWGI